MPCISSENKMSSKSPVIKFSPFEALFIGEKNKIVKRQPTKNAIFITRLNRRRKKISLRDLFDLEQNTSNKENKDCIFRMPQRVTEYLKNKKTNLKECNKRKKNNILYFDYNGKKMVVKSSGLVKSKAKNAKVKSNKIKFKKKLDFINNNKGDQNNSNFSSRVVKKFPSETNRLKLSQIKTKFSMSLVRKDTKPIKRSKVSANRHLLRGKDGKFISRKEYLNSKSYDTNAGDEHVLNSSKQSCVIEENGGKLDNSIIKLEHENLTDKSTDVCSLSKYKTATTAKQTSSMKLRDKHYQCYWPYIDLKFPKCPKSKTVVDLDDDGNLMDLVYENFPAVKFESNESLSSDFSDCLKEKCILPEKNVKIYEKKKNGYLNLDKLTVIFNDHCIPHIKVNGLQIVKPMCQTCKCDLRSVIDEPRPKNNHLINGKSFDCILFQDSECKEIYLGNILKSSWQNSWFGRLPQN